MGLALLSIPIRTTLIPEPTSRLRELQKPLSEKNRLRQAKHGVPVTVTVSGALDGPENCGVKLYRRSLIQLASAGVLQSAFPAFAVDQFQEPGLPAGESLRTLAGESLQISPMGLGTWAWGNRLLWNYSVDMDAELQRVFNLCVARGINFFDTGDSYGTGDLNARAETLLGAFLAQYPGSAQRREDVHIATKLASYPWRLTRESILAACRESKDRVGGRLDMAQIHWSTANYAPWQERALWKGLAAAYQQGLVRGVGASNYGPKQLRRLHAYLASEGVPLASNQVQYSLLSRDPSHVKETCDELGIAMIAYSPLALGLLTGKYSVDSTLPSGPRGLLFRSVLPSMGPLLGIMEEVAKVHGKSVPQVAVNWCLTKGLVPIPGAKNVRQAEENLGALGWRLSAAEVYELEAAAAKAKQVTQNIFQTQ